VYCWSPPVQAFIHGTLHLMSTLRVRAPCPLAQEWYQRLYQKPANYQLPEEDTRQLLYELESSYNAFLSVLREVA
jgi:hypothetical protein